MGLLISGQWHDKWYETEATGGSFERGASSFREWVRRDGITRFSPKPGRYHLYVSLACPWAHRTLLLRSLKGLEDVIPVSVVHPHMGAFGWEFRAGSGSTGEPLYGLQFLHQLYTKADPHFTGRVTVPILWDTEHETIVNNESSEIVRMLNCEWSDFTQGTTDYYPPQLREAIDAANELVYHGLNNGVYQAGFATTQEAYNEAVSLVCSTLDTLEATLSRSPFLTGSSITEADWRLFPTLVRFDAVYHGHFKCNRRKLIEYPSLCRYTRTLAQIPGVLSTLNMDHITAHYYGSHPTINPTAIVPIGPDLDFLQPQHSDSP